MQAQLPFTASAGCGCVWQDFLWRSLKWEVITFGLIWSQLVWFFFTAHGVFNKRLTQPWIEGWEPSIRELIFPQCIKESVSHVTSLHSWGLSHGANLWPSVTHVQCSSMRNLISHIEWGLVVEIGDLLFITFCWVLLSCPPEFLSSLFDDGSGSHFKTPISVWTGVVFDS